MNAAQGAEQHSAPEDVWQRSIVGWHLTFWLLLVLMLVRLGTVQGLEPSRTNIGFVLVASAAVSYAALVQRRIWARSTSGLIYLSLMTVIAGGLCWVDPSLSMFLFIAFAHVWVFTPRWSTGAIFAGLLTISCTAGMLARAGWGAAQARDILPQMVVGALFSLLMGAWVWRIIEQSQERAELLAQIQAARSELAAAHRAQGAVQERERLARDIHDTLAQGFTSIVMLAQTAAAETPAAAARLAVIEDVARDNLAESRALIAAFSPAPLAEGTLAEALHRLGERTREQSELSVLVVAEPVELPRGSQVVLLRGAQEALANVRRHANAHSVRVHLAVEGPWVVCTVADDGVGFDPQAISEGFGLAGLRARAVECGGALEVFSGETGSVVVIRVPQVPAAEAPTSAAGPPADEPLDEPAASQR